MKQSRAVLSLSITLAVFAFPLLSHAEDSMAVQLQLSTLLAAESQCGMTYDQNAIQQFIDKKVSADDLDFASSLALMSRGQQAQVEQMSDSGKFAFCAQQRRVAKKLNFVQ
ncbi:signal recognition particle [Rhizobium sp. L80/93]|uniref:signal recognition particle n=1 Tax=unclassified Rhizobium TaxID=2613769 RepID=UPI001AD9E404|nr:MULTISPECIES: signal recognition particle [unclassified Rhizobium]MBO9136902.1 signal recognition particle [Rhizobium sp. B209b/85]MBO9186807.1 signal recognition particle [Rhizobium sp. E27B/91]QXZ99098.1 signal recognition particle [Rhizobium sp. B230/85]